MPYEPPARSIPGALPRASLLTRSLRAVRKAGRDRPAAIRLALGGIIALAILGAVLFVRRPGPVATVPLPAPQAAAPARVAAAPHVQHRARPRPAPPLAAVDDAVTVGGNRGFIYSGVWQHLTGLHDGRSGATSSRSYRSGDEASLRFRGARLLLFGVRGPGGGTARLLIDGRPAGVLQFYAPRKEPGVPVYANSALAERAHTAEIIVMTPAPERPRRRFVNLDGAAYGSR